MQPLPAAGKGRGQPEKLKFGKQKAKITEGTSPSKDEITQPGIPRPRATGAEGRGEGRAESGWGEEMVE